jgi:hypothetical protein
MKRNLVWTILFAATLLSSLPAAAKEKDRRDKDCICSNADLAGDWGTTMTGTIINPATGVAAPFAAVNKATYDDAGNYWGTQTRSVNGTVTGAVFQGVYTLKPDCSGTKTTKSYDPTSKALLNTVTQNFVLINSVGEIFEIFTSNILPNGVSVLSVVTGRSQKIFPDNDRDHDDR